MKRKFSRNQKENLILSLMAGFSLVLSSGANSQEVLPQKQERHDSFILNEIKKSFGDSSHEVLKKLGKPKKIIEKKTENIHVRDAEETVFKMIYPGVTFIFLKDNDLHKEFLVEAELTGKEFELSWGVRIGISRERLIEIFGEPKERLEKNSIYRYADFESLNWVDFYFKGDSLTKIHWVFYLD